MLILQCPTTYLLLLLIVEKSEEELKEVNYKGY